jgi:DMSO/TMAO reductase YedYZ heme-binding membrane subunit
MYNVCKKMDFLDSDKYDTNFMIIITLGILTVISLICFIITSFSCNLLDIRS